MRDIRPDLRERLSDIQTQRLVLDQREQAIKALLQQEEARYAGLIASASGTVTLAALAGNSATSLSDMIFMTLTERPMTTDELKLRLINSYDFGTSAPGRVLNFTLQAMRKRGQIDLREGRWVAMTNPSQQEDFETPGIDQRN